MPVGMIGASLITSPEIGRSPAAPATASPERPEPRVNGCTIAINGRRASLLRGIETQREWMSPHGPILVAPTIPRSTARFVVLPPVFEMRLHLISPQQHRLVANLHQVALRVLPRWTVLRRRSASRHYARGRCRYGRERCSDATLRLSIVSAPSVAPWPSSSRARS